MTTQERTILKLNQLIDDLVAQGEYDIARLIVPIRDEKTAEYVNAGGTGWFGNAQVPEQ